jgi:hypothetical protein
MTAPIMPHKLKTAAENGRSTAARLRYPATRDIAGAG